LKLADFHFDLPEELIAQAPLADRAASRMLVVDRATGSLRDSFFRDLPELVGPGDVLVFNNTRVLPARLQGKRSGGGVCETLLIKKLSDEPLRWEALVRPGKRIRVGDVIRFGDSHGSRDCPRELQALVVGRGDFGLRTLEFTPAEQFAATLEQIGRMPLPPYIKRSAEDEDRERYQTVYARETGSAAAPTAGLHFTPEVLDAIRARGAQTAEITLHVGLGTFQPVHAETVEEHVMHSESFWIPPDALKTIENAKRVLAVGTTSVRTLEHWARTGETSGETDIFLYPGAEFRCVDAILTNFHLPDSTLILLIAAFLGKDKTLAAYRHAIAHKYRFYSYGDCMLIV
jgi:S-adenosylmethionine:tRNA ribosyltransferase-isomerase